MLNKFARLDNRRSFNKECLTGLTLMEIIVSLVLMSLVLLGLANLFVAGKRYVVHSRASAIAAELARRYLDRLQMQVRQDTWDQAGNALYIPAAQDTYTWIGPIESPDGIINFTPTYVVSRAKTSDGTDSGLRRVQLTISWQED